MNDATAQALGRMYVNSRSFWRDHGYIEDAATGEPGCQDDAPEGHDDWQDVTPAEEREIADEKKRRKKQQAAQQERWARELEERQRRAAAWDALTPEEKRRIQDARIRAWIEEERQ